MKYFEPLEVLIEGIEALSHKPRREFEIIENSCFRIFTGSSLFTKRM